MRIPGTSIQPVAILYSLDKGINNNYVEENGSVNVDVGLSV